MRGKATRTRTGTRNSRITPAYAGKSGNVDHDYSYIEDHPRLCGEKSDRSATCFFKSGSPPPMRGKVGDDLRRNIRIGITPAYAGKSEEITCVEVKAEDHPRLCGEKGHPRCSGFVEQGSPPPMRGKVDETISIYIDEGITPAYAGKRFILDSEVSLCWDHPRLCGEKEK